MLRCWRVILNRRKWVRLSQSFYYSGIVLANSNAADRINANDQTLPPQTFEKTDRTVVVPNTNKTPASNYDIGVFKVNNYRAWEFSIGYGQHGGDRYVPVELQRNFSKDAARSVEYHYRGHEKGFEAKYISCGGLVFIFT